MKDNLGKDTSDVNDGGFNSGFSTSHGTPMKTGQKQIVTGMDKLVNPKETNQADQVFDSSPARDINEGSANSSGGIDYKALKK